MSKSKIIVLGSTVLITMTTIKPSKNDVGELVGLERVFSQLVSDLMDYSVNYNVVCYVVYVLS